MWSVTAKMSGKTIEKTVEKTIEALSRYVAQLGTYNRQSLETSLEMEAYIDTVRIRGIANGTIQYTHTAIKLPSKRNTQQHAGTHVHTHYITALL